MAFSSVLPFSLILRHHPPTHFALDRLGVAFTLLSTLALTLTPVAHVEVRVTATNGYHTPGAYTNAVNVDRIELQVQLQSIT